MDQALGTTHMDDAGEWQDRAHLAIHGDEKERASVAALFAKPAESAPKREKGAGGGVSEGRPDAVNHAAECVKLSYSAACLSCWSLRNRERLEPASGFSQRNSTGARLPVAARRDMPAIIGADRRW